MNTLKKVGGLLFTALLVVGLCQTAEAQIWKKAAERAKEKIKQKTEEKTSEAVDSAVDSAADKAEDAVKDAVKDKATDAARDAAANNSGQSGSSGDMSGLTNALGAMAGASGSGGSVEPIDHRELKVLLPESLPGRSRVNARGEKGGFMGIKTSMAEGEYGSEGSDGNITITITDMGTMKGLAKFGYAWLAAEIDNESDNGYERTTRFKDFPAYEKYDRDGDYQHGEMQVVVGERFIVSASGDGVSMNDIKGALNQVDIAKLDGMKMVGQGEAFEPVDQAGLKALLPESLPGMSRSNASAQKASALGIKTSSAEGDYTDGANGSVKVAITDMGNLSGITMLGYAWLAAEIDNENDRGYERTAKYKGHPAYEKFDKDGDYQHSEIQVVVSQRFVVSVEGNGVSMDKVKAAIDRVDLDQLAAMKE